MSYLARAVVILNALAVIVGRSQTFSVQASFETGNPPKRVPIRSQNGAATPAGGPVETSWTPVGCLWSLWGCLGLLRGSPGDAPGRSEGPLGSVSRCSEDTSGDLFRAQRRKDRFFENRAPACTGAWILRSRDVQNEAGSELSSSFLEFRGFESCFLRVFSSSEPSKVAFFEFSRVLGLRSQLPRSSEKLPTPKATCRIPYMENNIEVRYTTQSLS